MALRHALAAILSAALVAPSIAVGCGSAQVGVVAQLVLCASLDSMSEEDMDEMFSAAGQQMSEGGNPIDEGSFESGDLDVFLGVVSSLAKCQPDPGDMPPPVPGINTNYCGPGNGPSLPTVSSCLNKLCYEHDACYYMCSAHMGNDCIWSVPTHPCDDAMLSAASACEHEPGTVLRSRAVLWLARQAYELGSVNTCPMMADVTCGGARGNGPCKAAIGADDEAATRACLQGCAQRHDRDLACMKKNKCDFDGDGRLSVDEAHCYAANCPEVEDCF